MTPAEVVERQIEAFNAKDREAFFGTFSEDVRVFKLPELRPSLIGKDALVAAYQAALSNPALRAEILSRTVVGNKVVDRERVINSKPQPYEVIAVYEVHKGLIRAMWFFEGEAVSEWSGVA